MEVMDDMDETDGRKIVVSWVDEAARPWRAEFSLEIAKPLITSISAGGKMIIESTPATYIGGGSTPATYL